ncbi:SDR family NAD(P)-dependent oxidoreductase [Limnospira platensis CENA597]|uniref:SDR family NAD(P)-dependent oxidoreductase n=1 Tax=Limnospira platensis TaxID=118562 RepID=UPI003D6E9BF8
MQIKKALVTGASFGIGEEFARQIARQNSDLVLVARSQDKLEKLAGELQSQYGVKVQVISQDLTEAGAGQVIFDQVEGGPETVDLLVNNAGFGDYGPLDERSLTKQLAMVQLNVTVLVELTHLFLGVMKARSFGAIVNVSSIAGYQALPYMSVYSATKAFVVNFSQAIWAENQDTGVRILCLCPGPTESNFFENAEFPQSMKGSGNNYASAAEVVKETLSTLDKKDSTLVTGGIPNQIIVNLPRLMPRDTIASLVEKQFRPKG